MTNPDLARSELASRYPGRRFKKKLSKMSDDQAIAMYLSVRRREEEDIAAAKVEDQKESSDEAPF